MQQNRVEAFYQNLLDISALLEFACMLS